ncbi:hypothetical protein ATI53_1003138 [Salipiger aestuarii]|uniref:Uncharacterized protein n=1 Tax=Salipiger aestuarii TaxID=568098 RepID=A0A327YN92_9RHOB|nr:hypothetical protein [Salipiger aestuarii]RAK21982.1 hypothetical protein ATI53_1003138 [Salipiger aestuarii]
MKTPDTPDTPTDAAKAPVRESKLKPTGSSREPGAKRSIFDDSYGPVGAETRKPWSRHTRKDKD